MLPLFFVVLFAVLAQLLGITQEWQQLMVIVSGLFLGLAVVRFLLNGKQRHLQNMLPVLLRKDVQVEKISLEEIY